MKPRRCGLACAALLLALPVVAQQPRSAYTADKLHQEAIREKISLGPQLRAQENNKEVIQQLYNVMDAFMAKDLDRLARYIHPNMLEFDSMSPYREIGRASFLEHMFHFFASPQHIEDHFMRIKDPFVQMYGDTAVVSFHYDTEASVGGQFTQNWGKASFVFVRDKTTVPPGQVPDWMLAVCHYSTIKPSLR